MPPSDPRHHQVDVVDHLADSDRDAVLSLIARASNADGIDPLSEHTVLHVRHDAGNDRLLIVRAHHEVVGFAHLDLAEHASGELVVDPAHRAAGVGSALVLALIDQSPGGRLDLWAHGTHPGAEALAKSLGFQRFRVLWQMRRPLAERLPAVELPEGVAVRTFHPGTDDAEWLRLNALAFAQHPEQGQWTEDDLAVRILQDWFDPSGFFVAERGGRMVGFHWTKVHGGGSDRDHPHEPVGEVYVVGVDPTEQGKGLGPALTTVGLEHLQSLGLHQAMLYVDESNSHAIKVYERLGFTHWHTDICFRR